MKGYWWLALCFKERKQRSSSRPLQSCCSRVHELIILGRFCSKDGSIAGLSPAIDPKELNEPRCWLRTAWTGSLFPSEWLNEARCRIRFVNTTVPSLEAGSDASKLQRFEPAHCSALEVFHLLGPINVKQVARTAPALSCSHAVLLFFCAHSPGQRFVSMFAMHQAAAVAASFPRPPVTLVLNPLSHAAPSH